MMSSAYVPPSFFSSWETLLQKINFLCCHLLFSYIAIAPLIGIVHVLMSFGADKYGSQHFLFRLAI